MRSIQILSLCLLASPFASAQQQGVIRGEIENVPGSNTKFFLDGTDLPMVSTVVRLDSLLGRTFEMKVTNVGTATTPILHVDAVAPASSIMDMGNMKLGQTSTWEVAATRGSFALIAVDLTANTGFTPFNGFGGSFLLGRNAMVLASGFANTARGFETRILTPQDPSLLNVEFTAQALVGDPNGRWSFSNPDSKVVEP